MSEGQRRRKPIFCWGGRGQTDGLRCRKTNVHPSIPRVMATFSTLYPTSHQARSQHDHDRAHVGNSQIESPPPIFIFNILHTSAAGGERERERDREAQESINNESLLSYYAIVGKKYITYCLRSDANAKSITLSGGRSVSLCDSAPSRTDGPRTQFAHRHLQTTITFCPPMPIGDVISHPSTWHQWN